MDDKQPLEQHIQILLTILSTRREAMRELWDECDLILQCVGYYPATGHGAHFNREIVRQRSRLGLAVDLDLYFMDSPNFAEA